MPNAASPPSPPRRPRGLFFGLATADLTSAVEERPAPNTKVTAISQSLRGGGPALNAAVAFAALGGSATLFAPVGRTALSMAIREDLAEHGVALVDLADPDFTPPVSAITVCTADGSRDVVSADGAGFPLRLEDETWDALDWAAQRCDVALLDGHGGQVALEAGNRIAALGSARVVLDAGRWREAFSRLLLAADDVVCSADFIVPREADPLERPADGPTIGAPSRDALEAIAAFGAGAVLQTQGAGAIRGLDDGRPFTIDPPAMARVVDTNGAGDIFHGAYCLARAQGSSAQEAGERAARVATFSCGFEGTRAWIEPWQEERAW